MHNQTSNSIATIYKVLDQPHGQDFKGHGCEVVHEALRYLPDEDWAALAERWRTESADWICNLAYSLNPDYHPHQAELLLIAILKDGGPVARACAADTLLFDSLYVPDAEMRDHLATCITALHGLREEKLRTYYTQLFQGLIAKQQVDRIHEAHEHSIRNRSGLQESEEAACYHCRALFKSSEVTEFTDNGETALCPFCGIDAVLPATSGYPLNYMTLRALHQYWF